MAKFSKEKFVPFFFALGDVDIVFTFSKHDFPKWKPNSWFFITFCYSFNKSLKMMSRAKFYSSFQRLQTLLGGKTEEKLNNFSTTKMNNMLSGSVFQLTSAFFEFRFIYDEQHEMENWQAYKNVRKWLQFLQRKVWLEFPFIDSSSPSNEFSLRKFSTDKYHHPPS